MLVTLRGQRINCKAIVSPTETIVKALKIKIKRKGQETEEKREQKENIIKLFINIFTI